MKKSFIALGIIWLIYSGCGSVLPLAPQEEASLIRIECKNELSVRQSVLQLLRSSRTKDIKITDNGSSQEIEAIYTGESSGKLKELEMDLRETSGVMYVEIKISPRPVINNSGFSFYSIPFVPSGI